VARNQGDGDLYECRTKLEETLIQFIQVFITNHKAKWIFFQEIRNLDNLDGTTDQVDKI